MGDNVHQHWQCSPTLLNLLGKNLFHGRSSFTSDTCFHNASEPKSCYYKLVWHDESCFMIHKVLNFQDWNLCDKEPFHDKIKRYISLELSRDLWHLNDMKNYLSTVNIEPHCVHFFIMFFPYCSKSRQLI